MALGSWRRTKTAPCVCGDRCAEAEFFGTMLAAKEVIFIRDLLIDLGFIIDAASVIIHQVRLQVCRRHGLRPRRLQEDQAHFARC